MRKLLYRIEFWIIIFFLLRLIGITNPPLEIGHNWRQALTCMIARNFYEGNHNILYPQIDMGGNQSGIIGSEFPFFNYLIYIVSLVFDYAHWYGRLINLIVSSIGIYYFYLLIEKITDKKIAFSAAIILLSSIWFGFSRKIMPDTFSVALVIIGLYYGYLYLTKGSNLKLLLFFLFISLGSLCKIPALSLISVVSIIILIKEIPLKRKMFLFLTTAVSFAIVCLWYFYWVPYLLNNYHYQLYFPKGLTEGFREILPLIPEFFEKFYFSSLASYLAFIFFLIGIFIIFKDKNLYLKSGITIITITFLLFILKTGAVFPLHSYYIIPFTPVMALVAGYGLSKFPLKYLYIPLLLISLESLANQQHDFFIKPSEKYKPELESIADSFSEKKDLIVINGNGNPQLLYFTHRKGWNCKDNQLSDSLFLNDIKAKGCKFIVVNKNSFKDSIPYKCIINNENIAVYDLK
ncbi:MAG: glycosyltransferase family 39 protein [Bacteroidetes bacterium]|nr:glycosyltransferase family 39 protein [Bacteroidota bacterium]